MTEPTKRDLRRDILAARRAMTIEIREREDALVRATLRTFVETHRPRTIAAYYPMVGEPGGPPLAAEIAATGIPVLLPVVLADRDLDWAFYQPDNLAAGSLGLTEPTGPRLGVAAITRADLVIVPALAADRAGGRLGRGGGSYDRALSRVRPPQRVIALLYPGEQLAHIPTEDHDRPVDGIMIGSRVEFFATLTGRSAADTSRLALGGQECQAAPVPHPDLDCGG